MKIKEFKRIYRNTEEQLKLTTNGIIFLRYDNKMIKTNFLSLKIKLYRFCSKFKVKKIENLLKNYFKESFLNEGYKSQVITF